MRLPRRRWRLPLKTALQNLPRRRLLIEPLERRAMLAADSDAATALTNFMPVAEGEPVAAPEPVMQITALVLEAGTDTPIASILAGRDFDLEMLAEDLRQPDDARLGVFAAYADIFYDKSLAKVRVPEVQTVSIFGSLEGSFTLTLNPGGTTGAIPYNLRNQLGRKQVASAIQTAVNDVLGSGTVQVSQVPNRADYTVSFVGLADQDIATMEASNPAVTVTETVKGDPTLAESFTEAFRSRDIGTNNGLPGPYQNGLHAADLPDRVDDVGAFGIGSPFPMEVARARVKARLPENQNSGLLIFSPSVSELERPDHDNLVLADISTDPPEKSLVPPESMVLVQASLLIKRAVVASAGAASIDEDDAEGISIPLLHLVTKDPAAPAGALELRGFTQAVGGTVTRLDPNNTPSDWTDDLVRFVPEPNFHGPTTFTYSAGIVGDTIPEDVGIGTITVQVNAVNDAPVNSVPAVQNTQEDAALVFSAAGGNVIGVTDVDADPAGVQVSLAATHGGLTLGATANVTFVTGDGVDDAAFTFQGTIAAVNAALNGLKFTPARDFDGVASFTITTNDLGNSGKVNGVGLEDADTVTIIVAAVNDPPAVAAPSTQRVYLGNTLPFSPVFGNAIVVGDVDAGEDILRVVLSTPAPNGGLLRAIAIGGADVTGNGSASMTISGSQSAINATLATLEYVPLFVAISSLQIEVNDLGHNPPPATLPVTAVVNITVDQPPQPFAVNDSPPNLIEGSASYLLDVLANDQVGADAVPTLVEFSQPTVGSVARVDVNNTPNDLSDDKLLYTPPTKNGQPDLDFFTRLTGPPIVFTYRINQAPNNGASDSPLATVSLRIANVPDAPIAAPDGLGNSYATSIGVPYSRNASQGLLVNDKVVDNEYGDPQIANLGVAGASVASPLVVSTQGGGTATMNADGSFSYVPAPGFEGDDTFSYRAHSSLGPDSEPAVVTIHVSKPPMAEPDSFTAQEDEPFTSPTSVLANDRDQADGEPLSAVLVSNVPVAAGSVVLSADGLFTFTPALDFNTTRPTTSPITFTYKVTAPSGRESPPNELGTVSIVVAERNDNPVAKDDAFQAVAHQRQLGVDQPVSVLENDDSSPDGNETLTVVGVNGLVADGNGDTAAAATAAGGLVRLVGFQIQYTSPPTAGSDLFTYTISDGRGGIAAASVHVTVAPLYDFGDAPDSYKTSLATDGARHVATGPQLGALREDEPDGAPTALANGDDLAEIDDEDGLIQSTLIRGETSSLTVAVVSDAPSAILDGWVDFNHDGVFGAGEKFADSLSVLVGSFVVAFEAPDNAMLGPTIARLRISTAGGLSPTGLAADGEVEDHVVTIVQDATVNLPTGGGPNRVAVRRNGPDVEVRNVFTGAAIGGWPLDLTHTLIVHGSDVETDEVTVDYETGGYFALPGGMKLLGGAGGGDELIVVGDGQTSIHYLSQEQFLGTAAIIAKSGEAESHFSFEGFEPLTFAGIGSFVVTGALNVGAETLTFPASLQVELGAETILAGGSILAPGGLVVGAGQVVRGHGTIETPDESATALTNSGSIVGTSAAEPISLTGHVHGTGSLDHVVVEGTLNPGASPAILTYGNLTFDAGSVLVVEVGGLVPGEEYDQLRFTGSVELNGDLDVVLIDGFEPEALDSFSIILAEGGLLGAQARLTYPPQPLGKTWRLLPSATELKVVAAPVWHNLIRPMDVRGGTTVVPDNFVDAGDALAIINYINAFGTGELSDSEEVGLPFGYLDVNHDNFIAPDDALTIINGINAGLTGGPDGEASGDGLAGEAPAPDDLDALISLMAVETLESGQSRRRK